LCRRSRPQWLRGSTEVCIRLDRAALKVVSREMLRENGLIVGDRRDPRLNRIEKRDRIEIVLSILEAVESGEHRPTRIMSRSNINWVTVKSMLKNLEAAGFLTSEKQECERGRPAQLVSFKIHMLYFLTDKGTRFLHFCREIYDAIESLLKTAV